MDTFEQHRDRVYSLAIRQLESALSPDEKREFESLLLESAEARRAYVEFVQESACLRWLCVEACVEPPMPRPSEAVGSSKHRRVFSYRLLGGLACALALVVAAFQLMRGSDTTPSPANLAASTAKATPVTKAAGAVNGDSAKSVEGAAKPVATITGLTAARWSRPGHAGRLLARYAVGDRVRLSEGSVELTFDAGAQVTVFGPADFKITSPTSIRCVRGRATALVDDRAKGFTIETPRAKVVDLGTQFGLAVSDEGETEVVVFQGSVDLTYSPQKAAGDAASRRMLQGEALLLKNSGELERVMSIQRNSFLNAMGAAQLRGFEPVIADVSDNIRKSDGLSIKSYQIVHGGLEDDALCFVDRIHQWNGLDTHGLPDFLVGADYIMPFNDDKFVAELQLNVRLLRPATLYVFMDNNMITPEWLRKDFVDTGVDIGMDCSKTEWHRKHSLAAGGGYSIDFPFSVWRREVKKADTITLGGVSPPEIGSRSFGFNMYGIAAVAKD